MTNHAHHAAEKSDHDSAETSGQGAERAKQSLSQEAHSLLTNNRNKLTSQADHRNLDGSTNPAKSGYPMPTMTITGTDNSPEAAKSTRGDHTGGAVKITSFEYPSSTTQAPNGQPQDQDKQHRLGIDSGPSGVKQAAFGDCFFVSSMASLATTPEGKQQIANMITENPDKSYSVRFPGDPNRPVTVDAKDMQTYGNAANVNPQALWARVIETAYLKERFSVDENHQLKLRSKTPDAYTEPYVAFSGKRSAHFQWNPDKPADGVTTAIRTAAGETRNDEHKMPIDKLASVLQAAMEHGAFMRASSRILPPGVGRIENPATGERSLFYPSLESRYPIVGDHDLTVLGFDAKKQTITVRNPWGIDAQATGDGKGPLDKPGSTVDGITNKGAGVLEMPLAVFEKYFENLHITGWQFKGPKN